jgi:two-component system copper resistance phosphate regulon response regulator CusR
MRILIIEDEPKVARAIADGLQAEGYSTTVSISGEDGFFLATTQEYDLLILDIMLPGRNGFEILEAARREGARFPVLALTALGSVEDRVKGLDLGADDYMTKPFAFSELLARVRAILRRGSPSGETLLSCGDLEMDCPRRKARRAGRDLSLTAREFDLLEYLLRRKSTVVSREMLARDVWRATERATPLDNVIDVHVARLRREIGERSGEGLLKTVRGVGFIVEEP